MSGKRTMPVTGVGGASIAGPTLDAGDRLVVRQTRWTKSDTHCRAH